MQSKWQDIENTIEHSKVPGGVCFDPDSVTLEGFYSDELSAHRAKRTWESALENHFLLEPDHDFTLKISSVESKCFALTCEFLTACARYAFWRLTNSQAPEAQYIIETAHIPRGESQYDRFMAAPDLCHIEEGPLILRGDKLMLNDSWFDWMKEFINRLSKKTTS